MSTPEDFERIESAAAEWLARRDRGLTADEARAFARWRDTDPRHAAAAAELALVWGALDQLSASKSQQPAGGVAETSPAVLPPKRRMLAAWWPAWGLAALLALMIGIVAGRRAGTSDEPRRYATAVGEQQTVALPDGSELRLNTNTALTVLLGARERRVTLERGEAFFRVAPDAARPFLVAAGRAETRVVGTRFALRRRETETDLLVAQGQVRFGPADHPEAAANIGANQHAVLSLAASGAPRVDILAPEAVARRLAWQAGRLELKDEPLRDAVAEFNRYHRRQIVLADPATQALRIGGIFEIGNFDGFVRLLDKNFDVVEVRREADKITLALRP